MKFLRIKQRLLTKGHEVYQAIGPPYIVFQTEVDNLPV